MPFWQFFRMGWNGCALLGQPSRIPHRNWKIFFVSGADECIERLEDKIRECLFLLKYSKITVCWRFRIHCSISSTCYKTLIKPIWKHLFYYNLFNFFQQKRGLDVNRYATKKTIAQGMLDVALLTANASQLKYVLQLGEERHEFYHLMLALIILSIVLQVCWKNWNNFS